MRILHACGSRRRDDDSASGFRRVPGCFPAPLAGPVGPLLNTRFSDHCFLAPARGTGRGSGEGAFSAAMVKMLRHAETSANAAMASAKSTQALVEVGQRPWISVRSMYLQAEINQFHRAVTLYTTLKNSGATPAQHLLGNHCCLVTDEDFPGNPAYQPAPNSEPIPISIAPNDEKRILVQMPLPDADIRKLINQEGRSCVYGVVTYRDTFGKEHCTKWCSRYEGGMYDSARFSTGPRHNSIE